MKLHQLLVTFLLMTTAAGAAVPHFMDADTKQVFTVRNYGAKGDGTTLKTSAIQRAVDAAAKSGAPSIITFPAGTYLTGSIFIKSAVNDDALCLKAGRDSYGLRVNRPTEDIVLRDSIMREGAVGSRHRKRDLRWFSQY